VSIPSTSSGRISLSCHSKSSELPHTRQCNVQERRTAPADVLMPLPVTTLSVAFFLVTLESFHIALFGAAKIWDMRMRVNAFSVAVLKNRLTAAFIFFMILPYWPSISAFSSAPSIFSFASSNSAPFCRMSFLLLRISSALAYSVLIIDFISSSIASAVALL
jgi:hypothetical protein